MDWRYFAISFGLLAVGYVVGWMAHRAERKAIMDDFNRLMEESALLKQKLHQLTDRDQKGRFVGGKTVQ